FFGKGEAQDLLVARESHVDDLADPELDPSADEMLLGPGKRHRHPAHVIDRHHVGDQDVPGGGPAVESTAAVMVQARERSPSRPRDAGIADAIYTVGSTSPCGSAGMPNAIARI